MELFDRRAVKSAAEDSLARASYDPKKLILIHTGVILALSLLLTVIDYLLEVQIGSTGGLSGIGARSILETAQSVLRLAQTILLPFWQIGYTFACLKISRQETAAPQTLTQGFRAFGPVLRLTLIRSVIYLAIGFICAYIASGIFIVTPWSEPLQNIMMDMMMDTTLMEDAEMLAAMESAIMDAYVPILVIFFIVFIPMCAPVFYQYRMADFCLMDAPEKGAFAALRQSRQMTRGSRVGLFKLDLSFWWFYGLDLLVTVVCYGDVIMEYLGVNVSWSAEFAFFFFFIVYLVCQLALYWWRKNEVDVTYAHVYAALQEPREDQPAPLPGKQPWSY